MDETINYYMKKKSTILTTLSAMCGAWKLLKGMYILVTDLYV